MKSKGYNLFIYVSCDCLLAKGFNINTNCLPTNFVGTSQNSLDFTAGYLFIEL